MGTGSLAASPIRRAILPFEENSRETDVMRRCFDGLLILLAGTLAAADEQPLPPDVGQNPPPSVVPVPPVASPPPLVAMPPSGFLRPDQPSHGPVIAPGPAQDLAMLEAGRPLFPDDPAVASAAL